MAAKWAELDDGPTNEYWGFEHTVPIRPKDGIKAQSQTGRFTHRWWATRWLRALTQWVNSARLARGRAYARSGQVISLEVSPCLVEARVQGTRPRPYTVRIEFRPLSDGQWDKIVGALAQQAIYAAELLTGEMPEDIEVALDSAGVSLFPRSGSDVSAECSCPDRANPCKHVAAVFYLLGERLEEDPFLLFALRGRTRDQLIAALRERRAARSLTDGPTSVSLGPPQDAASRPLEACLEDFWRLGAGLDDMHIRIAAPEIDAEMLKLLGTAEFECESLDEDLSRVYRGVSEWAIGAAYGSDEARELGGQRV